MSKSLQKTLSFFVVLLLVLSLCACGGKSDIPKATSETGQAVTEAATSAPKPFDPFAKYDPEITVISCNSVFDDTQKFPPGESIEDNIWTRTFKQELGINLKYSFIVSQAQYEEKLNLSIASGDIPDIFNCSLIQLQKLLNAGAIENDLGAIYDKYATDALKQINTGEGPAAMQQVTFGGKLAAFPNTQTSSDNALFVWIRSDWLKKLSLPEPKTLDDFYVILDAFVNKDPDGNGEKDTYAIGLQKDNKFPVMAIPQFAMHYNAYPYKWVKDTKGKLVYGSFQPQMKDALAKLAEMYKNGWLDKEFGVKDISKESELVTNGRIGVAYGPMWTAIYPLVDSKKKDSKADWLPFFIPSVDGSPAINCLDVSNLYYFVIRKGFKYPEAALKMMGYAYEKQHGKNATLDDIKKYMEDGENGYRPFQHHPIVNMHPAFQNLNTYRSIRDKVPVDKLTPGQKDVYDNVTEYEKTGDVKTWGTYRTFAPTDSSFQLVDRLVNEKLYFWNGLLGAPTNEMTAKLPLIDKLFEDMAFKIIMGKSSVENFDEFVQQANALGLEQITQQVNDMAAK